MPSRPSKKYILNSLLEIYALNALPENFLIPQCPLEIYPHDMWWSILSSPLLVDGDGDCWATINLFEDRIEWNGSGARMPDHIEIPLNEL